MLLIVATGTALRFYRLPFIPFTYDEVSAWARTGFSNFKDLIEQGVMGDGHPAGIQVFLNYWRMLFGDSEISFKLPFLMMGILCIWLVFLIGKFWFNETVGLLCAAFIATIQYAVEYSQIARPYISGLFFSLMAVWCWTNYLFNTGKMTKRFQLTAYILFASLCCYNHYFSLLFAFIIGVTGLFFVDVQKRWLYIFANLVVVILFLPHLIITLNQFKIGGVGGWLSRPDYYFFFRYLNYVFQFSWWTKGIVLLLIALGFFYPDNNIASKNKFRIICILWFFLPMLTGYFYSVYRNPVLQYSVLIFSFPFLLFFLFSFLKPFNLSVNFLLVAGVMITCSYALIFQRKHYTIFYHQPIEQIAKNCIHINQELNGNETVLINEPSKYFGYYLNKYQSNIKASYWQDLNIQSYIQFKNYLKSLDRKFIIAGNIPNDYLALIRQRFPFMISRETGFTYNFFCFSKIKEGVKVFNDVIFNDTLNFKQPDKYWISAIPPAGSLNDSAHFSMDATQEFSPAFYAPLKDIANSHYNVVTVSVHVKNLNWPNQTSLVFSFSNGDSTFFWQEKSLSLFMDSSESSGTAFYSISLRDVDVDMKHTFIKTYLWNKNKEPFDIDFMNVQLQEGNPVIYGLIEKVN